MGGSRLGSVGGDGGTGDLDGLGGGGSGRSGGLVLGSLGGGLLGGSSGRGWVRLLSLSESALIPVPSESPS